jgi:hypothetical protein
MLRIIGTRRSIWETSSMLVLLCSILLDMPLERPKERTSALKWIFGKHFPDKLKNCLKTISNGRILTGGARLYFSTDRKLVTCISQLQAQRL